MSNYFVLDTEKNTILTLQTAIETNRKFLFAELKNQINALLTQKKVSEITWALPTNTTMYDADQKKIALCTTCTSKGITLKNCACPIVGVCKEKDTYFYMVQIVKENNQIEKYPIQETNYLGVRDNNDDVYQYSDFSKWVPSLLNKLGVSSTESEHIIIEGYCECIDNYERKLRNEQDKFVDLFGDTAIQFIKTKRGNTAIEAAWNISKLTANQKEALAVDYLDKMGDSFDYGIICGIAFDEEKHLTLNLDGNPEFGGPMAPEYSEFELRFGKSLYIEEDLKCRCFYYRKGHLSDIYDTLLDLI